MPCDQRMVITMVHPGLYCPYRKENGLGVISGLDFSF